MKAYALLVPEGRGSREYALFRANDDDQAHRTALCLLPQKPFTVMQDRRMTSQHVPGQADAFARTPNS